MTEMVKIEKSILDGTFKPSGKWTHYHTTKVTPKWTKSMKDVAFVGNHKFGTIKG